jgi:hypothetical protein
MRLQRGIQSGKLHSVVGICELGRPIVTPRFAAGNWLREPRLSKKLINQFRLAFVSQELPKGLVSTKSIHETANPWKL